MSVCCRPSRSSVLRLHAPHSARAAPDSATQTPERAKDRIARQQSHPTAGERRDERPGANRGDPGPSALPKEQLQRGRRAVHDALDASRLLDHGIERTIHLRGRHAVEHENHRTAAARAVRRPHQVDRHLTYRTRTDFDDRSQTRDGHRYRLRKLESVVEGRETVPEEADRVKEGVSPSRRRRRLRERTARRHGPATRRHRGPPPRASTCDGGQGPAACVLPFRRGRCRREMAVWL